MYSRGGVVEDNNSNNPELKAESSGLSFNSVILMTSGLDDIS